MSNWYDQFNPFSGQGGIGDPGGLFKTNGDQPKLQGGYYGQDQINQQINQGYANANQAAPQIDPSQQAQFRAMQMQQAQRLQGIASGQQQGAGELAAQRQVQQAIAAQQGMAHMARGGQNAALAFRGAANNSAGIGLQGAGMSQQAALSDQQAAQGQLMNSINQGRSSDIGMAQGNANLQQQQYANNNTANLGYLNQQMGMGRDQLALQTNQYNTNTANANAQKGGIITAAGTVLAAASDENLKTDISDAGNDIDDMLNKLVAKTYRYKDEKKFGDGPRVGIMAQHLQKSKAGKALVLNLPGGEGLGFDVGKAVSAALASTARLNERMKKLEGARG
jgi:hypothetical protein